MSFAMPEVGAQVAPDDDVASLGKYRLIAQLGQGGMAEVNLAMIQGPAGLGFSKLAVVKRLRANVADDPDFVTMLVDEARISAHLRHPNVVQTLEVGVHEGEPFLALEYLDGQPFHRLRRRAEKQRIEVAPEVAYLVIADVLAGLHHAHDLTNFDGSPLSIVHRDVTPHNVFITIDGAVKVLDFGIAKAVGRAAVTQHGMVKGKLRYMSPEQAGGRALDRRTDVFSAGIMLWEAATGARFWGEVPDHEIGLLLTTGAYPASPRSMHPEVSEEIDAICQKALACSPDDRYATAADFRADLERVLGNDIIQARKQLSWLVTTLSEADRAWLRRIIEDAANPANASPDPRAMDLDVAASVNPVVVGEHSSPNDSGEDVPTTVMQSSSRISTHLPPARPQYDDRPRLSDAIPFAPPRNYRRHAAGAAAGAVLSSAIILALTLNTTASPPPTAPREATNTVGHARLVMASEGLRRQAVADAIEPPPPRVAAPVYRVAAPAPRVRRTNGRSAGVADGQGAKTPASRIPGIDANDPWSAARTR